MNELIEKIKIEFKKANALMKLISINVIVFLFILVLSFFERLFKININLVDVFSLPAEGLALITKPWTIISYSFLHGGFGHILFNMILLYFSGQIFRQYFSAKQLISLYLQGVVVGGLFFVVSINVFPIFEEPLESYRIIGASAGVMAILMATAFYVPNYSIRMFLIGNIKLWHLAAFFVVLDLVNFQSDGNEGGHLSHIGGALMGYFFTYQMKNRKDVTIWMSNLLNWFSSLFKRNKSPFKKVYKNVSRDDYEYNKTNREEEQMVDEILGKISKSGYDSLTKREKEILFKSSKK